ncbi:hypothetical protein [Paraflavitalea pollutisoli]|uniref:hypothetical protein n=1 Tax=Paraflavitalea pollutisoli TaxID=3034143 RepID=UPI0023EBECC4|nr:hypothetical protein [Paraflavitalea sp. H1-2-19X]
MEQQPEFTHAQSLELIQSMIDKARNKYSENGFAYLLWGWAVFVCSVTQFILLRMHFAHHYVVWFTMWIILIFQLIYARKRKKQNKVRTYTDEIVSYVWITFAILMFLFGFMFGQIMGKEYYKYFNTALLALYGMPTFLSGVILKTRALVIGGIGCWVLSLVGPFVPYDYQLLMISLAVVIAWIIPGYILQSKYKKDNA